MLPEWSSPLTPGIQLSNLSYSHDKLTLRAELGNDWPRMLGQLPGVGEGLMMTRNEAAILGRRMTYPKLEPTSSITKGANAEGGLWVNFRALGGAHALHTRREGGHIFGMELKDSQGRMVHRFTLTQESDLNEFCGWVRLHQECEAHVPDWICGMQEPAIESSFSPGIEYGGGSEIIESLIAACMEKEICLCATVRTPSVTQRASFVPASLRPTDGWWFASNDEVGLHFRAELLPHLSIENMSNGGLPALRCATNEDACMLRLELGDPGQAAAWRKNIHAMF